jgi:hypothetical protein
MDHSNSSFLVGCAAFHDLLFCAKERDDNAANDIVIANFFAWDAGQWGLFKESVFWAPIAMATFKPDGGRRVIVASGNRGEIWECRMSPMEETTGEISTTQPTLVRNLAVVEDVIYAVGMARIVYRRDPSGHWQSVGPSAPLPTDGVAGFNDLAAASATEMYAVGWEGEIWCYDGAGWSSIDSPTSEHLRSVCHAHDEKFYAVGYNGAMVRGRGETWELVETGRAETLMDVCACDGVIYVVTDFEILKLTEEGLVPAENFADPGDQPGSCLYLLTVPDGVFSMGTKDIFLYSQGTWRRVV